MSAKELYFMAHSSRDKEKEELFSVKGLVGFKVYFSNTLHLFVKFEPLLSYCNVFPLK